MSRRNIRVSPTKQECHATGSIVSEGQHFQRFSRVSMSGKEIQTGFLVSEIIGNWLLRPDRYADYEGTDRRRRLSQLISIETRDREACVGDFPDGVAVTVAAVGNDLI